MYITLNGNLVNLKNLQKCFIDNNRIILQYLVNGTIITDSLNYENVKINVNEELQLIEKDFQKIQDNLDGKTEEKIKQLEQKVKEQDQKIKDLNQDKITNEFLRVKLNYIKYLVSTRVNIFKLKKWIKEEIENDNEDKKCNSQI